MKVSRLVVFLTMTVILLGSVLVANQLYVNEQIEFQLKSEERLYEEMEAMNRFFEYEERYQFNELRLRQNEAYSTCMKTPFKSLHTDSLIQELLKEYQNEPISFSFYDVKNDYGILLNETDSYYGASIIKLLESLYLINHAMAGEISLSDTLIYKKEHISDYSLELEKYSLGASISLKDLIFYSISVSDNTAHEMLYEYIGVENLKSYASFLGISLTINDMEHFGYLTASDGMKILKEAYRILKLKNSYSDLLFASMNNTYYNSLNFLGTTFLHKYGLTEPYYNEVGIYSAENPYLLSLFTRWGYSNYSNKVTSFSEKIFEIYQSNLEEKEQHCIFIKNATI